MTTNRRTLIHTLTATALALAALEIGRAHV